ncbi:hypothetical protein [Dactylosporangium sp. NPDC048998]
MNRSVTAALEAELARTPTYFGPATQYCLALDPLADGVDGIMTGR